jgi:hypothetical protein
MEDLDIVGANLRNLQRAYRTYANNDMVPPPKYDLSKAGIEGFTSNVSSPPISVDELTTLTQKIAVEIARLQASGTSDPVIQARVQMFSKIAQNVDDIQIQVHNGSMTPDMIPITQQDYANFLPALGDTSAGVGGLLSKSGNPTMSSLFNSYDQGDISGSQLADSLFSSYADKLLNGLSVKYTSPNELALVQAQAQAAQGPQPRSLTANSYVSAPSKVTEFRGEFESTVQKVANPSSTKSGYDWKTMARSICQNIKRMSLNPEDFGCILPGAQVSPDFSWRGHCKMVCSRLATHYDPGMPEQMGCPPATWKGWRL